MTHQVFNKRPVLALKSDKKALLRFYKNNRYSAKFIGGDRCYLIKADNTIVASVIVSSGQSEQHDSDKTPVQYLLHALLIAPAYQKQGLASSLLKHALNEQPALVCFAKTTISQLYLNNGFSSVSQTFIKQHLQPEFLKRFRQYTKQQPELTVFSSAP